MRERNGAKKAWGTSIKEDSRVARPCFPTRTTIVPLVIIVVGAFHRSHMEKKRLVSRLFKGRTDTTYFDHTSNSSMRSVKAARQGNTQEQQTAARSVVCPFLLVLLLPASYLNSSRVIVKGFPSR